MQAEAITTAITTKIKEVLQNHAQILNAPLTASNAEDVIELLKTAILDAGGEGLKTYLQESEIKKTLLS